MKSIDNENLLKCILHKGLRHLLAFKEYFFCLVVARTLSFFLVARKKFELFCCVRFDD